MWNPKIWLTLKVLNSNVVSQDLVDPESAEYNVVSQDLVDPESAEYNVVSQDLVDPESAEYNVVSQDLVDPESAEYNVASQDLVDPESAEYNVVSQDLVDPESAEYNVVSQDLVDPESAEFNMASQDLVDPESVEYYQVLESEATNVHGDTSAEDMMAASIMLSLQTPSVVFVPITGSVDTDTNDTIDTDTVDTDTDDREPDSEDNVEHDIGLGTDRDVNPDPTLGGESVSESEDQDDVARERRVLMEETEAAGDAFLHHYHRLGPQLVGRKADVIKPPSSPSVSPSPPPSPSQSPLPSPSPSPSSSVAKTGFCRIVYNLDSDYINKDNVLLTYYEFTDILIAIDADCGGCDTQLPTKLTWEDVADGDIPGPFTRAYVTCSQCGLRWWTYSGRCADEEFKERNNDDGGCTDQGCTDQEDNEYPGPNMYYFVDIVNGRVYIRHKCQLSLNPPVRDAYVEN